MNKYNENSSQFYRDCQDGSTFIESFEKDCADTRVFSTLIYALGCKFSEEGTTNSQEELLKLVANCVRSFNRDL